MPRRPCSRAHATSRTASSTSQSAGTIATPARRSGAIGAELGQPAVVGARARPLQLGVDALGRERQAGPERRHVHLGDAVGKDHLAGDAVGVEDGDPRVVIPGARELPLAALPPLGVDLVDQELLRRLLHLLRLDRQGEVEDLAILRVDVVAVALRRQAGMTVGRDHEMPAVEAIHGCPPRRGRHSSGSL